jgi:ligand-binding sensor domain-containing protein
MLVERISSRASVKMRRVFILLILLAADSLWAVDPSRKISQYSHTAWRSEEGYFSGFPLRITQTTDGYIWIGPHGGPVRFDGVRFVPWPQQKETQLWSRIDTVFGARDGSLWIGGQARSRSGSFVQHWVNREATTYELAGGLGTVTAFLEDRDGTIWFLHWDFVGNVCHIVAREIKCYGKADGIPEAFLSALVQDKEGYFWIGGSVEARVISDLRGGGSQVENGRSRCEQFGCGA